MSDQECGWCFTEMNELVDTHPGNGENTVGYLCPNCDRVYLEIDGCGTKRLDTKAETTKEEYKE